MEGKRWTDGKESGYRWEGKEVDGREKCATGTTTHRMQHD